MTQQDWQRNGDIRVCLRHVTYRIADGRAARASATGVSIAMLHASLRNMPFPIILAYSSPLHAGAQR